MSQGDANVRGARAWLARGAIGLLFGVVACIGNPLYGQWIAVAALLVTVVSLHRFGRLGPESPTAASVPDVPGA